MKIWQVLQSVRCFQTTQMQDQDPQVGKIVGSVVVDCPNSNTIVFHEKGSRQLSSNKTIELTNVYCWQRNRSAISLSHLRLGKSNPVHLATFRQVDNKKWKSGQPHLCGADSYQPELIISEIGIQLNWQIDGPNKGIQLQVNYSSL